jgi:hypothetical protein
MGVRLIVLASLLALLGSTPPAAAAERRVPRGFYGVVWDQDIADAGPQVTRAQLALMARTGVESVRTVFSWTLAQPRAGEPPSFARTDEVVGAAAASGIQVLPIVMYSPRWARRHSESLASPPRRVKDYGAYLEALVGRYGPRGSFWAEHPELP